MAIADDNLERQREQIAAGAGFALARWQLVEMMLTFFFVSVVDRSKISNEDGFVSVMREPPERRTAHAIFNAIIGFDARLAVIAAAVEASDLSAEIKEIWPECSFRIRRKYSKRNEVAHFIIENLEQDEGPPIVRLTPFAQSIGSYSAVRLDRHALDQRFKAFTEIGDGLRWLRESVEIQRGRSSKSLLPEPPFLQRSRRSAECRKKKESEPPSPPSGS